MIAPFALSASVTDLAVRLVALPVIIGCITGFFALLFRMHTGKALPEGPALILGLGILSLILNTRVALVQFVGSGEYSLTRGQVLFNLLLLGTAGIAATAGRYGGNRIATSTRISSWMQSLALPSLRWIGRAVTVRLPDQIDDIDGYDPIAEETREVLEGLELEFPRGLTTDELREAIAGRLKDEHAVGYVDIEVSSDASVEYLALGRRAATLGATLPPGYRAVAIHGDPPFSASPGDTIQIWRSDSDATNGAKRVGKGELRATVDAMATVVVDEGTVDEIDAKQEYRFMTVSADSRVDQEFASMLRTADETMSVIDIMEDSALAESAVGDFGVTVIAIRTQNGEVETLPNHNRVLRRGESIYAIGMPAALRQLEVPLSKERGP